jgi:hypothetical protein
MERSFFPVAFMEAEGPGRDESRGNNTGGFYPGATITIQR